MTEENKKMSVWEILFLVFCASIVSLSIFGGLTVSIPILSEMGKDIAELVNPTPEVVIKGIQITNTEAVEPTERQYIGTCSADVFLAEVYVYKAEIPGGVAGMYTSNTNTMILEDVGINAIAHEVSHVVDDFMSGAQIHDDETEAYLQGYLTECVYGLVTPVKYNCTYGERPGTRWCKEADEL